MRNDKNADKFANAGKPWDEESDAELLSLFRDRKSLKQIANKMQRTEEGIFARMGYHALEHANPKVNWQK
jgi:hypothetical protein